MENKPAKPPKLPRRVVNGVLLLDKPLGLSSNDALIKAKRLLQALKAGHTGTLDPFATGLLPLCFGEATKFSQDLLEADKTYETIVHLGQRTTTGDTEGEIIETLPVTVQLEHIHAALARFRGPLLQVPPMYSALKRDGKPLYEYARAGLTLEREARPIVVHELTLLDYQAPMLRLRVCVSKGTYIRVLGEDLGTALGCGAHLHALRRIQAGSLQLQGALTLDTLQAMSLEERTAALAPVDRLLQSFPAVHLPDALVQRFLQGQRIALGKHGLLVPESTLGRVRVYDLAQQLLGTAQMQEAQVLAPERLVAKNNF
jgi:tRNA pseudouridine55 synthase